jgi:Glycosyl hydrolase family 12
MLTIATVSLSGATSPAPPAASHRSASTAQVSHAAAGDKTRSYGHISCQVSDSAMETSQLDGGLNNLQANEYNSSALFTICGDGSSQFEVTTSGINLAADGTPGAYPSLYRGCHWGTCTSGSRLPVEVAALEKSGTVTTSYATQTVSEGTWDDSYDIFYAASPTGTQDSGPGIEMMIWLTQSGSVTPAGSMVASRVTIGGEIYNVWWDGYTVTYVRVRPVESIRSLDLGPLAADAVSRGYMPASWYLIDVEAGFEIWHGGTGLTARSFSVCIRC